ncbi:GntR family transcriptional regulator [Jiangella asiatica]|uniref:GntR family transcriptional regulator n=1 Tax=Jiangella asiatica TaxID=2530372 RepID=A0A4V2Z3L0_9ACTN|nr:GntR family transcriptional regulator [Jiangella asiatica]TDE13048.1 GntR family transcriptional regulator [Jiangella asiatica]
MSVVETPRARYRQVAEELRNAIKRGEYQPGEMLPSQPELARKYGLNQTSINRAIALLRAEGLVRVEHGRGAFVQLVPTVKRTRRVPRPGGNGSSFADEMRKAGLDPRTELVSLRTDPAPVGVAERLGLDEGGPVVVRERHMFASERPVQLAISYIPLTVAGSEDIAVPDVGPTGLYKRLAERGYVVTRFVEEIESRRAHPNEAGFLGLTDAQQVLEVARVVFAGEQPVETVVNVFPAQQWRLSYEWNAEGAGLT